MGLVEEAEVVDIHKKKSIKGKPVGLNTVKLLQIASQSFGMSA